MGVTGLDYENNGNLKTIAEAMVQLVAATEQMAKNTDPGSHHVAAVYARPDGSYGVLCYACSQQASDVVSTCLLDEEDRHQKGDWPPLDLFPNVNDKAIKDLEAIRKIAAGALMDSPPGDPRQFLAQAIIEVLTKD